MTEDKFGRAGWPDPQRDGGQSNGPARTVGKPSARERAGSPRRAFQRTLYLNRFTGTYHVHRNCIAITPQVEKHLSVVHRDWAEMPNLKLCGFCAPGPDEPPRRRW